MVQAGIGTQRDHALASLLGLNGLRVSEALNADIDDLGFERGHHVLQIIRKGGRRATVPLEGSRSRLWTTPDGVCGLTSLARSSSRRASIGARFIGPSTTGASAGSTAPSSTPRAARSISARRSILSDLVPALTQLPSAWLARERRFTRASVSHTLDHSGLLSEIC